MGREVGLKIGDASWLSVWEAVRHPDLYSHPTQSDKNREQYWKGHSVKVYLWMATSSPYSIFLCSSKNDGDRCRMMETSLHLLRGRMEDSSLGKLTRPREKTYRHLVFPQRKSCVPTWSRYCEAHWQMTPSYAPRTQNQSEQRAKHPLISEGASNMKDKHKDRHKSTNYPTNHPRGRQRMQKAKKIARKFSTLFVSMKTEQ